MADAKLDLKDTGERRQFATGAQRDRGGSKPRLGLVPGWSLFAWGWIMEAGANKYAARNWEKGMPISEYLESGKRHLEMYQMGFRDEPHLWMALWNIGCAVHTQIGVALGIYERSLYDLPNHVGTDNEIFSDFEKERLRPYFKTLGKEL